MAKNDSTTFTLIILLSGIIIAGGIFVYRTNLLDKIFTKNNIQNLDEELSISPIDSTDHILGRSDADVIIVEYSDFGCPFCKEFHNTMRIIIDNYASQGRIAWVYRHTPLDYDNPESRSYRLALVSECVAKLGGQSKFWQFTNKIFDNAPSSLETEQTNLIIEELKLDPQKIEKCTNDPEIKQLVEDDIEDAKFLVSKDPEFGTPYNIIITETGLSEVFSGSIPYILVKDIVEEHSLDFN